MTCKNCQRFSIHYKNGYCWEHYKEVNSNDNVCEEYVRPLTMYERYMARTNLENLRRRS